MQESGTLEATVVKGTTRIVFQTRYMEKPWLVNLVDFNKQRPKPGHLMLIARSPKTSIDEKEARQLSLEDAAEQLTFLLNGARIKPTGIKSFIKISPDQVIKRGFIADRFIQNFTGREGRIWRQALLLDVPVNKIMQIKAESVAQEGKAARQKDYTIFSFLGMIGLILGLYALANAATKGYYTLVLRFLSAVLISAAMGAVLFILRR